MLGYILTPFYTCESMYNTLHDTTPTSSVIYRAFGANPSLAFQRLPVKVA